ncbi:MAG: hypothetical protein ACLTJ8_05245 [Veillonella atypica]
MKRITLHCLDVSSGIIHVIDELIDKSIETCMTAPICVMQSMRR